MSLGVAARFTLIRLFSGLKRSEGRLKCVPKSTRWEYTPGVKHRGPGMARAEHAMDGIFCVLTQGVCSLSPLSINSMKRPGSRLCLVKASVAIRRQIIQLVLTAQHLTTVTR